MKHNILGFSQEVACKLGLDIDDLMFLRYFVDFKDTGSMQEKYLEDIERCGNWLNYTKIINDLPIIFSSKSKAGNLKKAQRILNGNLSKVINKKQEYNKGLGGSSMYIFINREVYRTLVDSDYCTKTYRGTVQEYTEPVDENVRSNISIIDKSINNSIKKERKKKKTYDEIINNYSKNDELRETILEFIKMRKLNKSNLTDRALELMLKKLDTLAKDDTTKIAILNQSIQNCWKGIFPLKNEGGGKNGSFGKNSIEEKYKDYDFDKNTGKGGEGFVPSPESANY
ncbi:MAG: hypothetical protein ACRCUM_04230 [Mycoplasmoidaceae bacterium]